MSLTDFGLPALNLSDNKIGPKGATALAPALAANTLMAGLNTPLRRNQSLD